MYIRSVEQKNKTTGMVYTTYRLVEAYRNAEGKVRQQVLLNLGCQFEVPKEQWKLLADRIEAIRQGQQTLIGLEPLLEKEAQRIAKLVIQKCSQVASTATSHLKEIQKPDHQTVDLNSLEHQDIRKIGGEYVGYHAAKQLQFDKVLLDCGFNQRQVNMALATIIGRLVHPGSELSTHRYLMEHSALDELLETDFSNLSLKKFYQMSDRLLKHKSIIEQQLFQREKDLFNLEDVITLFDITNTYFEGRALKNAKARFGRSKEKRNDCPLVALGMVLDASGFPKKSEIFPGNVSEPNTLQQMLTTLGADKKVTVVMDAGIATDANLAWLKASNYRYIVVSRKKNPMMPEKMETIIVKENKNNRVQVSLIKNENTDELELYCHSQAKEEKAKGMVSQAAMRYEAELEKLAAGLNKKNGVRKYEKIAERLGRLKEKYKRVAYLYEVTVETDEQNKQVIKITWQKNNAAIDKKQRGIYCLRTNQTDQAYR